MVRNKFAPKIRKFDGKNYKRGGQWRKKSVAKEFAGGLRERGYLARVVPETVPTTGKRRWAVYTRRK